MICTLNYMLYTVTHFDPTLHKSKKKVSLQSVSDSLILSAILSAIVTDKISPNRPFHLFKIGLDHSRIFL